MRSCIFCLVAFLLGAALASEQGSSERLDGSVIDDGVLVLTGGPVHDAFTETVTVDPQPGIVTSKVSSAAIEKVPPEALSQLVLKDLSDE